MNEPTHRMTWMDTDGVTWRVERVADRWQLSRFDQSREDWHRVGSYPNRASAVRAAYTTTTGGDPA
jgi:hypothetical protein